MLVNIFKPCLVFTIFVYGIWSTGIEIAYYFLPLGVILSGLLTFLIYMFRVPAPDKEAVRAIVGEDLRNEANPNEQTMKVAAHRGAGLDAPENSLLAFKLCADKECYFIEFDITLTKDNVPVVFHDNTLERMTGSTQEISKMTWSELSQVDISVKHPFRDRYPNTRIPTLNDTVQQLLNAKQHMFIDIKDNKVKMVNVILELFNKYPELYSKAVVSSFFPNIIYLIRRSNPKIVCSLAWRPNFFSRTSYSAYIQKGVNRAPQWYMHYLLRFIDFLHAWLLNQVTYYFLGLSLILLHKDVISPKTVADWNDKGVRVVAWTVNHPAEKQYFARVLKITYMTDTLTGENSVHLIN